MRGKKRSNGSKFKLVAGWHRPSQQSVGQRQEYTSTDDTHFHLHATVLVKVI